MAPATFGNRGGGGDKGRGGREVLSAWLKVYKGTLAQTTRLAVQVDKKTSPWNTSPIILTEHCHARHT